MRVIGEKQSWHAHAFRVGLIDLADEMVERIEVDATHRDASCIDGQQLAPDFLLRRMQAQDNDRVWFHVLFSLKTRVPHSKASTRAT
jgi:hypothetical protein